MQITNLISLYNIHIMAIEDILGRPLRRQIEMSFNSKAEEAEALLNLIVAKSGLCKGFRLSKKLTVDGEDLLIDSEQTKKRKIEWPSRWSYCKSEVVIIVQKAIADRSSIKKEAFQQVIVTQKHFWGILIEEGWLSEQQHKTFNWFFNKVVLNNETFVLPVELDVCKVAVLDYLKAHGGQEVVGSLLQSLFQLKHKEANLLFTYLTEKGLIHLHSKDAYKTWLVRAPKEAGDSLLPAINDFFTKFNGCKLVSALFQHLFKLEASQADLLIETLDNKKLIEKSESSHRQLEKRAIEQLNKMKKNLMANKEVEKVNLPPSLMRFDGILIAWWQDKSDCLTMCLQDLPLPTDQSTEGQLIWNNLVENDVIKEPSLNFPKISYSTSSKHIQSRLDQIKKVIDQDLKNHIEPLCRKYSTYPAAASDDYELGWSDVVAYLKANPLTAAQYGLGAAAFLVPGVKEEERSKIKAWLKQTKEKEVLDAYINRLTAAVTGSAGQLKILPEAVSASFRKLGEYFTTGRYPLEVDDFESQMLDQVILLSEYKSWWDWRAFTVAMIGVLQIATGVAISFGSGGLLSPIGTALIGEGVSDILFVMQTGLTGNFRYTQQFSIIKNNLFLIVIFQ